MSAFDALSQVLHARWSCRAFRPDPIPEDRITRIVEAASRVPTWNNVQPWGLIITRPEETDRLRARLLADVPKTAPAPDIPFPTEYAGIYKSRRYDCAMQLYDAVGCRGDRDASARQSMRNFALFDAPHAAILHSPAALGAYGALDCGAFATAFCLAAESLGVATIVQAAIAAYAPSVRDHFDLPEDRLIVCAISFGLADTNHPINQYRTPRATAEEVIDWR